MCVCLSVRVCCVLLLCRLYGKESAIRPPPLLVGWLEAPQLMAELTLLASFIVYI